MSTSSRAFDPGPASTALLTDRYELTMLDAARDSGVADRRSVFELFARRLPAGRRYGVVSGIDRIVASIAAFRFGDPELQELERREVVRPETLAWLAELDLTPEVDGYRDGEIYVPHSPILTVRGTFAEAVVFETVLLSILNHDVAIASAAARMVHAANGKPIIEMGGRRTHDLAAVDAARAAYVAGFASTSNLEAGRRYGLPTAGTAAHAFTLAHGDELEAFTVQLRTLGPGTTLLVDTFDVETGIRVAVQAAQGFGTDGPGAIRLDSGDPLVESRRARALLDELGAARTRIVVTSDLDEYEIDRLERAGAPIDGYGVGTQLVTGSGHPTAQLVYKLVAIADRPGADAPLRPVAKRSVGKATVGGHKQAFRLLDPDGVARAEQLVVAAPAASVPSVPIAPEVPDGWSARPLQVPLLRHGVAHDDRPFAARVLAARAHHGEALAELPREALELDDGLPVFEAVCLAPVARTDEKPEERSVR